MQHIAGTPVLPRDKKMAAPRGTADLVVSAFCTVLASYIGYFEARFFFANVMRLAGGALYGPASLV